MSEELLLPAIYPFLVIYATCSIIGIISNFAIAFATFRNENLRSSCNYLIALAAVCDALHPTGHLPFFINLSIGQLRISSQSCIWREAISIIGQNGGSIMVLSIGVDRLVACVFPIFYTNKNTPRYLFTHCFALTLYLSLIFCIIFSNFEERQIVCMLTSPYMGAAKIQWLMLNFAVCGTAIVVYIAVAVKLRITKKYQVRDMHIFRSLFIILVFVTGGYLATFGIAQIYQAIEQNPDDPSIILSDYVVGLPVNLSVTSTYWVYYATSSDYRQAFRAQLYYLTGWKRFQSEAVNNAGSSSSIVKRL